ncbi:hypothetical protein [Streptomyces sp. NPDC008141]|uniref:hypothetical protein n=1 Tax=Streptomyces sp. NPDC008141 TaxID=3364815 RepID=UPI0036F00421
MNHTKRVLVALALAGAVLSASGTAHAQTPAAPANIFGSADPDILGINLGHVLHGLGLGVGGQLLGNARG